MKNSGFSVVELLLAATIGVVLIAGCIEMYLGMKATYVAQQRLATVQENGRLATIILRNGISDAEQITGFTSTNPPQYLRRKILAGTDGVEISENNVVISYFISKTSYKDQDNQPVYALYRSVDYGNKEELISGVANMQIRYGVDINSDRRVDEYRSASQIAVWERVLSVVVVLSLVAGKKRLLWPSYIVLKKRFL